MTRLPLSPRWLFALVLLLAFAVRVGDMFWHPWAPDEQFSIDLASGSWSNLVEKTAADTHPPFYYALLKVWFAVVGPGLFRAKLLSIVVSIGTLALLFALADHLYNRRAAWLALLSGAFLPYSIYWSHTARMHPVQPLFITAIIYGSYRYLADGRRRFWALTAVAWALAIQTNYMALVFGLLWGAAFLLVEPAAWRRRIALAFAPLPGLLLFAPWFEVLRRHQTSSPMTISFFQESVTPGSLYYHAIFGKFHHEQGAQSFWFLLPAAMLFATALVFGARAVGRRWSIYLLLLGLPGLPIVIAAVRDFTLAERHLFFSIPFFLAFWGAGVDRMIGEFEAKRRGAAQPQSKLQP